MDGSGDRRAGGSGVCVAVEVGVEVSVGVCVGVPVGVGVPVIVGVAVTPGCGVWVGVGVGVAVAACHTTLSMFEFLPELPGQPRAIADS